MVQRAGMAAGHAQPIQIDAVLDVSVGDREQEGIDEPCKVAKAETRRQRPSPILESTRARQNRSGLPQAPRRRGITIARSDPCQLSGPYAGV